MPNASWKVFLLNPGGGLFTKLSKLVTFTPRFLNTGMLSEVFMLAEKAFS